MLFLISAGSFLTSCNKETSEIELRVNHFKQSAVGLDPTLVYLVQEGDEVGTEDWTYLYNNIIGFDYEWGYVYDLMVERRNIKNPPQDGSSVELSLVEVLSKTSTDEPFSIQLKSTSRGIYDLVSGDETAGFDLFGEVIIDCQELCEEMFQLQEEDDEVTGIFVHSGSEIIVLGELIAE